MARALHAIDAVLDQIAAVDAPCARSSEIDELFIFFCQQRRRRSCPQPFTATASFVTGIRSRWG
jgi:hypothetical protein